MSQLIVIFGCGPLARLLNHLISTTTNDHVIAFTVDSDYRTTDTFEGKPLYSYEDLQRYINANEVKFLLAFGYSSMRMRANVFNRLKNASLQFYNYISPFSFVDPSVILGENTIIFPKVVIEPFCTIGDNNLFWSSSTICHDSIIGDNNFFASNSTVGGECFIGNCCFFAFSSTVVQNITVSDESLVGASSLVLSSTEASTRYLGCPAVASGSHHDTGIRL